MLHNLILAIGWPLVDDSEEVDATVEKFVDCALRWYHVEMDRATLCTITSMALLAVYHADQGSPSLGWIYLSAGGAIVSASEFADDVHRSVLTRDVLLTWQWVCNRQIRSSREAI